MKRVWRWTARVVLLLIAAVVVYQFWIFGSVVWWIWFNPSTSAFMEDRLEVLQQKNPDAVLRHRWVPYERISRKSVLETIKGHCFCHLIQSF